MSFSLLSVDEVKRYLNISDFRHLTKDKLIAFVSAIPYMDRDVAIKIVEQFPEFSKHAQSIVTHYDNMISAIIEGNAANTKCVLAGYHGSIEILGRIASMETTSPDDRRFFAEMIIDLSKEMAEYDLKVKSKSEHTINHISWVIIGALAFGATLLGVNMYGRRIPSFS